MIEVIGLYTLFAVAFITNRATAQILDPITAVGMRLLIGGIGALLVAYLAGYTPPRLSRRTFGLISGVVIFNIVGTNVLEMGALQQVCAAKAALMYTLSPFVGALLAYLCWHQKLTVRQWLGLLIGCVGVSYAALSRPSGIGFSYADLMLLGAACSTVIGWMFVQQLLDTWHPLIITGWSLTISGLALACTGMVHMPSSWPAWGGVTLAAALLATAYTWYAALLRRYSVVFMTFASFTSPILTALLGAVVLHEPLTTAVAVCLVCVGSGLYLFYYPR